MQIWKLISPGLLAISLFNLSVAAQDFPTKQPSMLHIVREQVKTGRAAEHARHESDWVAAYEKAKSPYSYLALTSITGPNEAWYLAPSASHAEMGKSLEFEDKDPVLSAEVARLARGDAEFVTDSRNSHAVARPDLSYGPFPNLAKARFFEVEVLRARPGHEAQIEAAGRAYTAARKRAGVKSGYRTYQVIAGLPSSTYLIISSVEKFADFDTLGADHLATMKEMTPAEAKQLETAWAEGAASDETNRFRVDPAQSYVSKETRASDPEFWGKK